MGTSLTHFIAAVLKWVPLGSPRGIFNSWEEICSREKLWKKKPQVFNICSFNTSKLHEVSLYGNVYSTQGQAALPAVTDVIRSLVHNRYLFLHSR